MFFIIWLCFFYRFTGYCKRHWFCSFYASFLFLFKVIAYWILKADDEHETQKYLKEISAYNHSIESKFQPSDTYKKNKEQLKNINQTLSNIKNHFDRDYKTIRSSKFEIVLLKKHYLNLRDLRKELMKEREQLR